MKKTLLCLLSCLWIAVSAEAFPIGKQKAQAIAQCFLTEKGVNVDCLKSSAEGLTTPAADGSRPFYVFNNGSNKGFVIVSGDDRAPKILGYSYTGSFQEENIPENLSSWLDSYASEVQILKQNTKIQSRLRKAEMQQARVSISPLLMTHWNQYAPYYNLTPTKNGQQCVTGCVATAFAQVMKYYEWPKKATNPMIQGEEVILPSIVFKWSQMLNDYQGGLYPGDACNDSEESQTAVAELMLYCGKSVYASYGTSETSANSANIPDAMKNYFGYQGNIVVVNRSNYSSAEWDDMIYNELYNGRPVIYSGRNVSGGHAFVCDGYGEDDYFHINWGWGGMSDGYYLLSILEPGAQGAGGSNGGYSNNQSAIIGIQPSASTEVEAQTPCLGIMDFSVEESTSSRPQDFVITSMLISLLDGNKQYNAQLLKNGKVMYEGTPKSMPLPAGAYYIDPTTTRFFSEQTLADGTYEVRLVCRMVEEGKENEWIPCIDSEKYNHQVTIEGNTVVCNNTILAPNVICSSFTTSPTIYVSNKTSGVAHLSNEGGFYFQGKIYLWLNGEKVVEDMAYIDAGKSIDLSLTFTPSNTGTLPVKITTDSNGEIILYEGSITVIEEDENAKYELVLTDWSIDNLDKEKNMICGGAVSGTLTVTNIGNKTYSGKIGVGFSSGGSMRMSIPSTIYTLAAGESVILVYNVDEKYIIVNNEYSLDCYENGLWDGHIGSTNSYKLIAGGYTYWTADGTSKSKAEENNENISIVDDAVAVKFFNTPTGTITPNSNSNTLYYLSGSSVPESLSGKNVILNGKANEITFADGSNFYVPLGFTAVKATYTRVPTLGANGSSGWETILLPFPVQKVMNQTDDKQIYWFVSRDDDGKDFWLKSFSATDGETVFFDFVDEIRANVPYIIATPGNKWGEEYDLRGKTMAFIAENVKVPESSKFKAMTDDINFVGVSTQQNVTGYVLDEIGKYFVMQENAPLKAFRAFFTFDNTTPVASAPRLRIGSYQTDGISDATTMTDGEADVYSLDGIKVGTVSVSQGKAVINHLPQGIYIVNGKKIQRQ